MEQRVVMRLSTGGGAVPYSKEGDLLMLSRPGHFRPDRQHRFAQSRISGQLESERENVDETTEASFEILSNPIGMGNTDYNVGLATIPGQKVNIGGQQRLKGSRIFF